MSGYYGGGGSGSGDVTASGTLTGNAVILGNGTTGVKAVTGITTDGQSAINLGTSGVFDGMIRFYNTDASANTLVLTVPSLADLGDTILTLPTVTDTLVGVDAAQTLTNKTIDCDSNIVTNVARTKVDADNTLPATCAKGEIITLDNGAFFHGQGTNDWDQVLKASDIGGVRAVTGTTDTILSTDFSKLVTFTNAATIAVTLPQAGSGSPASWLSGWYFTAQNIGNTAVTITPTTSTINGASTLQLGPGQGAMVWSNGTNYLCVIFDSLKIGIACSDETTAITTGTAKATFRMPCAMKLLAVRASVTTAPTGADLIIDINEAGTTVLSTKLSIDAGEKTSTTAATPAVISDAVLADDAEITVDFDQVGSTIAGAGVKIWLIGIPG